MHSKTLVKKYFKATMNNAVVAFVFVLILLLSINLLFKKDIDYVKSIINLISVNSSTKVKENVKIDLSTKNLESYPSYTDKYASISISSLNINLPVYFGDSMSILRNGIGHSSGSYFPGEGGTILYMGHNDAKHLKKLVDINIGDEIVVDTSYGKFIYSVDEMRVIYYKDMENIPIQRDEEMLILYTCYQNLTVGHTPKRFVVYAGLKSSIFY